MRLQKRALLSPSRGTFPSPQEAFSSSEATAVKASGRGNQPNEEDTFVSFSFFIVLMALPVVSVLFMCLRYMCERQSSRRERRERRERARAALRTHFVLASSSLPETSAANGDWRREEGVGGSDALVAFLAANDTSNNNARRGVVDASTIDRLADAVIAGANPGYRRRRSSRRRRRIEENSIESYRTEAVRRDLRRAFRTGDFSNYDRNILHGVLQEQLPGNGAMTESDDDDEETRTNFRISAENGDTLFVADEPGPASRKTLQSLPSCKIGDKNWQLFIAGRARDDLQNLTTCALCLEDLKTFQPNQHQVIVLECEHVFCKSCVIPWFQLRASCPTCRRVVFAYSKEDRESVFSPPPLPEKVPSAVVAKEEKDAPREKDVEAAVPA